MSDKPYILPELRSGDVLVDPKGRNWIVHKVRKPRRSTGYDEPFFRLERVVTGNREWAEEELSAAGLRLKG